MTVEEFVQALEGVGAHTTTAYRSDLVLAERFLGKPLSEASEADMARWLASQAHLKAATVRRRLLALRRFFSMAEARDLIAFDPTGNLELPKLARPVPRHLTADEVERLLSRLKPTNDREQRDFCLVKLLYYTGIRIGEAQRLDLSDVNWETRQLRVRGRKLRQVPLNHTVFQALEAWLEVRSRQRPRSEALFVSLAKGSPLSYGVLRQQVKAVLLAAGFGQASPHQLRHTFATQLVGKGAPLEQVSQLLGHSRLDTTLIYTKTESGKLRNAVDLLG